MAQRIELTKSRIEAIPCPPVGQRTTVYDAKVPNLAVRVTPTGVRSWYVVKRTTRGVDWLHLDTFPRMSVEQARLRAQSELGKYADGEDPAAARRAERAHMTLGQAFETYMERHIEAHGKKSGADLRQMWERCLGELPDVPRKLHARPRVKHPQGVNWQHRKVNTLTRDDVGKLHLAIGKTTPTLANRVVELLSAIFNQLSKWGVDVQNPAAGIEAYKETKRKRFLQRSELPRFFDALNRDASADFRDFVLLALLTGARRSNVLGMRWRDLNLEERALWTIPADVAKAGEDMDVPLVEEAIAILKRRSDEATAEAKANKEQRSEFVFPAPSATGYMTPPKKRWANLLDRIELKELGARILDAGGAFKWKNDGTESLERALVRARKLADELNVDRTSARIEDLRLHDLRRSLGSWQAMLGASLPIVGKSLGHKSPGATAIYARLDIDPVRDSMQRATTAMRNAGKKKRK